MRVSGGSDAREQSRIVSARVVDTQPVLEVGVSARIGRPTLRILTVTRIKYFLKCYRFVDFVRGPSRNVPAKTVKKSESRAKRADDVEMKNK